MELPPEKEHISAKGISAVDEDHHDQICQEGRHNSISFHLKTLWLFTRSDLKSMIYPNIVFGLASAMAGPALVQHQCPDILGILTNLPAVALWLWLNLLLFNVANQRLPSSILEDTVNKPWRPLPSERLQSDQARMLLMMVIPLVFLSSFYLGATPQVLLLIASTWMYNDLGGADHNFLVRNILNALGMSCYSSGATIIACGHGSVLTPLGYQWIALLGFVILTTLQVQDMSDQEGDAMRGRRTLPLVMGDGFARWATGGSVMAWSIGIPTYWRTCIEGYAAPVLIGVTLTFRILAWRSVESDKGTWKMWCFWIISFYFLPLWSQLR